MIVFTVIQVSPRSVFNLFVLPSDLVVVIVSMFSNVFVVKMKVARVAYEYEVGAVVVNVARISCAATATLGAGIAAAT